MRLQTVSHGRFLAELAERGDRELEFAEVMALIKQCFGLMTAEDPDIDSLKAKAEAGDQEARARLGLVLRESELDVLRRAWEMSLLSKEARAADAEIVSLYGTRNPIGVACTHIHNRKAGIGWIAYGHTGTPVSVSAVGMGQGMFGGCYDNTEVARTMMSLIGARPARKPRLTRAVSHRGASAAIGGKSLGAASALATAGKQF
jgi:hypothetical protein